MVVGDLIRDTKPITPGENRFDGEETSDACHVLRRFSAGCVVQY